MTSPQDVGQAASGTSWMFGELREAGLAESEARVLVERLGVETWADMGVLKKLGAEYLMASVSRSCPDLIGMRSARLWHSICSAKRPRQEISDEGLGGILDGFGAFDCQAADPSNQLLFDTSTKELFVPTYHTVVVKRIRNLDEFKRSISLALTVVLRFDFRKIPLSLSEKILENFRIRINDILCDASNTEHAKTWINSERSVAMITLRVKLEDVPFFSWTEHVSKDFNHYADFPFDRPRMHLAFELVPHTLSSKDVADHPILVHFESWKVRYNFHRYVQYAKSRQFDIFPHAVREYLDKNVQLKILEYANKLPNFEILGNSSSTNFPLEWKTKPHHTPSVQLTIPLTRHPGAALRSMVLPLLALNFGTLATMSMNDSGTNFNDRLTNVITLMVALFAFLGYARASMPDVPSSTWVDRAVMRSCAMSIAVMCDSLFAAFTEPREQSSEVAIGDYFEGYGRNEQKGGSFHYFFDRVSSYRSIMRCFGLGVPVVLVQCHTALMLYKSYARYRAALDMNSRVLEFLNQHTSGVGGDERFSRRQYVHPKSYQPLGADANDGESVGSTEKKLSLGPLAGRRSRRRSSDSKALDMAVAKTRQLEMLRANNSRKEQSFVSKTLSATLGALSSPFVRRDLHRVEPADSSGSPEAHFPKRYRRTSGAAFNRSSSDSLFSSERRLKVDSQRFATGTHSDEGTSPMHKAGSQRLSLPPYTDEDDETASLRAAVLHDSQKLQSPSATQPTQSELLQESPPSKSPTPLDYDDKMPSPRPGDRELATERSAFLRRSSRTILSSSIPEDSELEESSSPQEAAVPSQTTTATTPQPDSLPVSPQPDSPPASPQPDSPPPTSQRKPKNRRRGGTMMYSLGEHPVWDSDDR